VRWQRRKVLQMVRTGGRLTRAQRIAADERECRHRSHDMETSTKKLVHVARQVAGKTVEDALVQMRFSKKKTAKDVIWALEEARDKAVVSHGMGLGGASAAAGDVHADQPPARRIQTRPGHWIEVADPTRLYVAQSWVGKGAHRGNRIQYHARGRMSLMRRHSARKPRPIHLMAQPHPFAWRSLPCRRVITRLTTKVDIAFILKEEKTRVRLHGERAAKEAARKPWVHLPNRPVTAQRQYYSW
jgi:ribosomal protein L22